MSKAFKCDRCGNFYEPTKSQDLIVEHFDKSGSIKKQDMCPTCYGKLVDWWKKGKETDNEN